MNNSFEQFTTLNLIGNTPLIYLKKASEETGCTILGKAEFLNPGQSVKDRPALYLIKKAIERNELAKGGIVVEGTAGNTGIGLALVGNAMGMKTIIVIPRTQSKEKKDTLRMLGAQLVEVDANPYKNPNNYVRYSKRLAEKLSQTMDVPVFWANQFDNVDNALSHMETTAEEIYSQLDGKIDGFIAAVGSGGSLGGIAKGLKTKNKNIKIGLADPEGAALYSYYTKGKLESTGSSITEGIGQGRITKNIENLSVDMAYQITDKTALEILFHLNRTQGLCLGTSTGINVGGAIEMAKELGPGHTIVTLLCDYGNRYQGKLYNPSFLKEKKLPIPDWMEHDGLALPDVHVKTS